MQSKTRIMNFLNEIKLTYSKSLVLSEQVKSSLNSFTTAKKIYTLSSDQSDLKEYFYVLYLDQGNYIVSYLRLSEGSINATTADIRLIFATALKCASVGIILVHNHPSNTLQPSTADKVLTKQICEAGEILDIRVLDHIILTKKDYYSFADEGLL